MFFLTKWWKAKKKKTKEEGIRYILKWIVERRHKIPQALDLQACYM